MKASALPLLFLPLLAFSSCEQSPKANKIIGTYDKDCAVYRKDWLTAKDGIGHLRMVFPVIVDEAGTVIWNGEAISDKKLREYTLLWSGLNPQPQVILDVNGNAPCHRVEAVRDILDAAPICRGEYSYCSEGQNWREWEEHGQ
jgi:hypothetical protein